MDPPNSILVFHPPSLSDHIHSFIHRLLRTPSTTPSASYPLHITNKYYSATPHIHPILLTSPAELNEVHEALDGVPAVMWVFSSEDEMRPASVLIRTLEELRPDIQLAVHIDAPLATSTASVEEPPDTQTDEDKAEDQLVLGASSTSDQDGEINADQVSSQTTMTTSKGAQWSSDHVDRAYELFAVLGMDFIDLAPPSTAMDPKERDEDLKEQQEEGVKDILQALEVHMWQGMVRKQSPSIFAAPGTGDIGVEGQTSSALVADHAAAASSRQRPSTLSTGPSPTADRKQLLERTPDVDEDGFVKLEEWLNLDEMGPNSWEDAAGDDVGEANVGESSRSQGSGLTERKAEKQHAAEGGFDDAFNPFVEGPASRSRSRSANVIRPADATLNHSSEGLIVNPAAIDTPPLSALPAASTSGLDVDLDALDPTTLLSHLQTVRTQLSALPTSQRHARAAAEVQNVFRSLGIDMAGLDLELEDLGFDDGEEGIVTAALRAEWEDVEVEESGREGLEELMAALGVKDDIEEDG